MTPNNWASELVVLGQGRYSDLGGGFRRGDTGDSTEFVLLVAGLVTVAVVVILVARYVAMRQERGFSSERTLLSELCRAHGLSWTERRLLGRLAGEHGLAPRQLFLQPERFDPGKLASAKYAAEFAALREKLFRKPPPRVAG